jgi:hypothetical protein
MSIVDGKVLAMEKSGLGKSTAREHNNGLPSSIPASGGQSEGVPFAATMRCCTAKMVSNPGAAVSSLDYKY